MNKPTVKDVAVAAGVSLATVDRVLNTRAGVRKVTIERVNAAIKNIGFVRDQGAANLARQRNYNFVFVLPDSKGQLISLIRQMVAETNNSLHNDRISASVLSVPANDPHAIVKALQGLKLEEISGVAIMAPETPQVRDAISRLKSLGISVVAFVSNQPNSECDHFVGIDNIAAGKTAATLAGRFTCNKSGDVLIIADSMQSRDSLERRLGFDQQIASNYPNLRVLPSMETYNNPERTKAIINAAFASSPAICAIYMLSPEVSNVLSAIQAANCPDNMVVLAHELTPSTREALSENRIDVVITQDIGHLVRSALRILRAKSDGNQTIASQERIRIEIILCENMN